MLYIGPNGRPRTVDLYTRGTEKKNAIYLKIFYDIYNRMYIQNDDDDDYMLHVSDMI